MTTASYPPLRFFGSPKSRSTKSRIGGATSLTFAPDMRCAATGANRSRPSEGSQRSGRPSFRFVISRTSLRPSRRAAGAKSPLSLPTRVAPTSSAEAPRALFGPAGFLLSLQNRGVRRRRPSLAVLELRLARFERGLRRLHGDALGRECLPLPSELRAAFLDPDPLGGDRLLPSFRVGLGAAYTLLGVRLAVFDLVDPMLEALFLLPEGGLLRLHLPLAGLDQGFSALDFLIRPGFSSGDRVRPFLEFLGFLCVRRLGFLGRG